jgi:hypothetical protein
MADEDAPLTRAVLTDVLTAAFAGFEREVIAPQFRQVHERLDGLSGRMDDVFGHVDGLYKHIDTLQVEYQAMRAGLQRVEGRLERLEDASGDKTVPFRNG